MTTIPSFATEQLQISHPKKRQKITTPKFNIWSVLPHLPSLPPSHPFYFATEQLQISHPKKRRHFTSPLFDAFATVQAEAYRYASIIQTYPIKQIKPHHNKLAKQKHLRIVLKSLIKFEPWKLVLPATVAEYMNTLQIFPYRTLPAHLKKKLILRRHLNSKYGTKKFDAFATIQAEPYRYTSPIQPYLSKQLIPKWKFKSKLRHEKNFRKGSPKYDTWKAVIIEIQSMPALTVNIINTLLKLVKVPR